MNLPSPGATDATLRPARWLLPLAALLVVGEALFLLSRADVIPILSDSYDARWIRMAAPVNLAAQPRRTQYVAFRQQFQVEPPPAALWIRVRAYRAVTLYLNGIRVAAEPTVGEAIVELQVDLAPHLRPGRNELVAMVANNRGPPALLTGGELPVLNSGPDWQASADGRSWQRANVATQPEHSELAHAFPSPVEAFSSRWLPSILLFVGGALAALVGPRLPPVWQRNCLVLFRWGLLLGLALIFWYNFRHVPPHVGMDLSAHLDYLEFLLTRQALPLATDGWQMFQPPLAYLLLAAVVPVGREILADLDVTLTARALTMAAVLLAAMLGSRAVMHALRDRMLSQWVGVTVSIFFPASLYLAHAFGNEPFFALFAALLFYWVAVRMDGPGRDHLAHAFILGVICGLALLTKTSAVILVAVMAWMILRSAGMRTVTGRRVGSRNLAAFALSTSLVGGWWYLRNLVELGRPFVGGWDANRGIDWWQYPGYRLWGHLVSFGEALIRPVMAGVHSFWDGLYGSLWGDGYLSGIIARAYAPNWDYAAMHTLYLLAVPVTLAIIAGLLRIFWAQSKLRPGLLIEVSAIALLLYLGIMFHLYATIPIYSAAKGSYLAALAPGMGLLAAWGVESMPCTPARRVLTGGVLALWIGTVASAFTTTGPV